MMLEVSGAVAAFRLWSLNIPPALTLSGEVRIHSDLSRFANTLG